MIPGRAGAGGTVLEPLLDRLARRAGAAPQAATTAAPLFLHAPRRRAEPAGALPPRRAGRRRPRAGRREPGRPTARARSTGGCRPRTARWSPSASPPTAARSRCCACATSPRARPARRDPRTRACSLAWTPDGRASTTRVTRRAAPCRPARRSTTAASSSIASATIRRATSKIFGEGRDLNDWPGVDAVARRPLADRRRIPGMDEERGLSRRHARRRRQAASRWRRARVTRASTSSRCSTIASTCAATSGAPRGRMFAVDLRHPQRARWQEILPRARRCSSAPLLPRRSGRRAYLKTLRRTCVSSTGRQARARAGAARAGQRRRALRSARGGRAVWRSPSFLTPTTICDVQLGARPEERRLGVAPIAAPLDAAAFEVEQVMLHLARRHAVPAVSVHRRGRSTRDGSHPPCSRLRRLQRQHAAALGAAGVPFLEHGGVYAVAILRGGGEYGESLAPGRHARRTSRTSSTISSPPPNG